MSNPLGGLRAFWRGAKAKKRLAEIEVHVLGADASFTGPAGVMNRMRRFERICTMRPAMAWKQRLRLRETLRGFCALMVASGRHDEAARLLSNPIMFAMVGFGDGRWQEVLKPMIDGAAPRRLWALETMLGIAARKSLLASTLHMRVRARRGGLEAPPPPDLAALAAEANLNATPLVMETHARLWCDATPVHGERTGETRPNAGTAVNA